MRSGLISVLHSGIQQLVNFGKMPSAIFPKHYNWSYMHLKIHFDLNKALCYSMKPCFSSRSNYQIWDPFGVYTRPEASTRGDTLRPCLFK